MCVQVEHKPGGEGMVTESLSVDHNKHLMDWFPI